MAKKSTTTGIDPILVEAKDRFDFALQWEDFARRNFLTDLKFVEADADNGYQWPDNLKYNRELDERPILTINKTRQHCLLITNDMKQNKPGIKFLPTGNEATYEAAQAWAAIARRIEYQSNAQDAYDKASDFMVKCGIGYWRVVTEYSDTDSFNQEIYIRRINDPLKVLLDPDAKEADKSDSNFAFIFEELNKKEFAKRYPKWEKYEGQSYLDPTGDWISQDSVRIAEYFRVVFEEDTLFQTEDGQIFKAKDLKATPDILNELKEDPHVRKRPITNRKILWHLIIGDTIVETKEWVGKYIPIIPIIGEETVIEGRLDRKGHTRSMKDPQRMYNYWSSAAVEYGALQSKSPYIAPAEAIEGYETYWETSNRQNHAILPYNGYNDAGQQLVPPSRQEPPVAAPVAVTGMQITQAEFQMVSGQYGPAMGEPDNSRTGKAIGERQRQGDKATYHYINSQAIGIRQTGKIIMDLVPKIYDVTRVLQAIAEDGTTFELKIDPDAQQAYQITQAENGEVAQRILNPQKGQFEVIADVGPGYATRREEAFNAFTLILTQAPQMASLLGDLLFLAADFPMAAEAAQRLRRMVPPQAMGKGPTPTEQQLQQQMTQMQMTLKETLEKLAEERLRSRNKAEQKEIGVYNAETNRLKVVGQMAKDGVDAAREAAQMELDLGNKSLETASREAGEDLGNFDPPPSPRPDMTQARLAPDGNHYVPDPARPGKYLLVRGGTDA